MSELVAQQTCTTLDQLKAGAVGRILQVEGSDGVATRLREMGFIPGMVVRSIRSAPLGDPLSFLVLGSRVALRGGEARRIRIVPER